MPGLSAFELKLSGRLPGFAFDLQPFAAGDLADTLLGLSLDRESEELTAALYDLLPLVIILWPDNDVVLVYAGKLAGIAGDVRVPEFKDEI